MKKELLLVGALVVSLGVSGCSSMKEKPQEINLNDYFTYELVGYDGQGQIDYSINFEDISRDYENLDECKLDRLVNDINGEWSQTADLSNGDKLGFSWNVSASRIENEFNVVFVYEDIDIIVDNLEVRPEFNPFDYMEVSISGIAPGGSISIPSSTSPIGNIYYSASQNYGLRNGDVITITATDIMGNDLENAAYNNGYQLASDSMEYTVSGLNEYITSMSDITDDALNMIQEQAILAFYANTNWINDETINSLTVDGMYFMNKRENSSSWNSDNRLIVVLKINGSNSSVENFEYYYYVSYEDLVLLNDGTVTVDTYNYQVPYGSLFFGVSSGAAIQFDNDHYYVGYMSVNEIFMGLVQNNLIDYTYETTYTE